MTNELIEKLQNIHDADELLAVAGKMFDGRIALASSFSAEDQIITEKIAKAGLAIEIFTLDTGRLPEETYKVIDATRRRYGIDIEVLAPDGDKLSEFVSKNGPNSFYDSVEKRKACCAIRKVEPLKRKLARLDAWICGLRAEQSPTRTDLQTVEWDAGNGLVKISPLAGWSTEMVWDYVRQNDVPYNKLHDMGYESIGCAPCTRAIKPGEDIRAGRWWWENPEHKECGLHLGPKKTETEKV
ncbi:Phosphoadenosine phosphosulfate reductase [Anaerohalosphaera lusitana]|uniref:Adenosine 5'-phosphosulfate reductase n=1 Tax=Anaerohalosphaera lusitana TaxID=1936003 RepID=A0A1U9NJI4_9BACT|nr:phosphoadenylyl-sulfate reductase [Anaerohalosphaera lusitana]AQT67894.1 Phosphoadenosine phosphosulfate reductase [Anaerohalosphaera lusitana]